MQITVLNGSPKGLTIGTQTAYAGQFYSGWLDEIRISKGIARWAGGFAPPNAPMRSRLRGGRY